MNKTSLSMVAAAVFVGKDVTCFSKQRTMLDLSVAMSKLPSGAKSDLGTTQHFNLTDTSRLEVRDEALKQYIL